MSWSYLGDYFYTTLKCSRLKQWIHFLHYHSILHSIFISIPILEKSQCVKELGIQRLLQSTSWVQVDCYGMSHE